MPRLSAGAVVSFNAWSRSLLVKIIAVFVTATLALLLVLWLTLGMTFDRLLADNVEPYLTQHLTSLQHQLGSPPDLAVARRLAEDNHIIIEIDAPDYQWSSNATFVEKGDYDIYLRRFNKLGATEEAGFYDGNFIFRTYVESGYIISFIVTEKISPNHQALVGAIVAILTIVGAMCAVIWFLFKPIKVIQQGVQRIGNGEVAHRLDIDRQDELGMLSISINKMADNIEQMLDAKRQLLLAISHELRTPITRTTLALSMLEDKVAKDSIAEDMQEMEALIEELLESERLRGNHAPLDIHHVNVNEVIYQVQGRFFDKAPLVMQLAEQLPTLDIDPRRIGLAVKNMIKNALTASLTANLNASDKVIIRTAVSGNAVAISVSDSGAGIDAKDIPHLTEPFYRADSSRQRKTGGFGIGLHLIKCIADAHRGQLRIESDLGRGATVTLLLPLPLRQ